MVSKVTFRLEGAREIEAAMRELGARAAGRIARSAVNRAATPIVKRAKELASTRGDPDDPHATGLLKKSITKRLLRQRRGSSQQNLGPRRCRPRRTCGPRSMTRRRRW
jgi:hypothetical protein